MMTMMMMIVAPCCVRCLCFLVLLGKRLFMAINTKISLYLWSYPRKEWNRISLLPVLLVKLSKYFAYTSQGHFTFRENPIIRIAAKLQYKIPSLRTLAVMDTISWSRGCLHRKSLLSYKDLEAGRPLLMWTLSSAPTSEIGTENRSVDNHISLHCDLVKAVRS